MKQTVLLLVAILFAACAPTKQYQYTKAPWENEISKLLQLDQEEEYTNDAILFIGSSSIRLWKDIKEDMAPYEPIRRGYGGAHFSDMIHYVDQLVEPHNPKGIVIFIANDIAGSENDLSPEEVIPLFAYCVKQIKKLKPGVPIFQIAVTPTPSRWGVYEQTEKLNSLLKNYCDNRENLYFIDTTDRYILNGKPRPELFIKDQLHLNSRGYDLWATIIKEELDKVFN